MGPEVRKRGEGQIADSLASTDTRDVLETLLWLAGNHLSSDAERRAGRNQESLEHSELFEAVCARADVRRHIDRLRKSKNAWVREYAKMVAERDD